MTLLLLCIIIYNYLTTMSYSHKTVGWNILLVVILYLLIGSGLQTTNDQVAELS